MREQLKRLWQGQAGQTLVENTLLLGWVALLVFASVKAVTVERLFRRASGAFGASVSIGQERRVCGPDQSSLHHSWDNTDPSGRFAHRPQSACSSTPR